MFRQVDDSIANRFGTLPWDAQFMASIIDASADFDRAGLWLLRYFARQHGWVFSSDTRVAKGLLGEPRSEEPGIRWSRIDKVVLPAEMARACDHAVAFKTKDQRPAAFGGVPYNAKVDLDAAEEEAQRFFGLRTYIPHFPGPHMPLETTMVLFLRDDPAGMPLFAAPSQKTAVPAKSGWL